MKAFFDLLADWMYWKEKNVRMYDSLMEYINYYILRDFATMNDESMEACMTCPVSKDIEKNNEEGNITDFAVSYMNVMGTKEID